MVEYLVLLNDCLTDGARQKNRTGKDTFMIPGGMMQFDLSNGFPIITTKKIAFGQLKGELLGFIRGYDSAALFRQLGCNVWDANANKNEQWLKNPNRKGTDDLGRIYGKQWRDWEAYNSDAMMHWDIDQLAKALQMIRQDPTSRRIIVSAWQPGDMHRMALPPCHLLYQFMIGQEEQKLHMTMYMRSCDMFLGVPFNISSYALLLSLVARVTGYEPGMLTMFLADAHIYEDHLEQVKEQLARTPRPLPSLELPHVVPPNPSDPCTSAEIELMIQWLEGITPDQIQLTGYDPAPAIKAEMAV